MWNEADDSFSIEIVANDSRAVITSLMPPVCRGISIDPDKISGRGEWPYGKGGVPRKKLYNVAFEDGYIPIPGEEPFISFRNDKAEFRLVFLEENYAELRSSMALEIHDDPGRREYDHLFTQSNLGLSKMYEGYVRHWMAFGPYVAICAYEEGRFALRAIYICDASDDNSWVYTVNESYGCGQIGFSLPPQPLRQCQQSWWQKLCCSCY
jgi:hypothetical protein